MISVSTETLNLYLIYHGFRPVSAYYISSLNEDIFIYRRTATLKKFIWLFENTDPHIKIRMLPKIDIIYENILISKSHIIDDYKMEDEV
ncbi:MAG: hypothetical protein MJH11_17105 [Lentisphaeria bacterium]|nr:hypothetical protein [Lentisphaeria bacterium]